MPNDTAIDRVSSHIPLIATGHIPFAPISLPRAEVVGTIGLPIGSYGTEPVVTDVMELVRPTSRPVPPPPPTLELSAGVGTAGTNRPDDVRKVQRRLRELGFKIRVDGLFGPRTSRAIKMFASIITGSEFVRMSGTDYMAPGSWQSMRMARDDAPRWVSVSGSGTGWTSIDKDGYGWGTDRAKAVIVAAGKHYEKNYRQADWDIPRIMINDISRRDGTVLRRNGKDEHVSHRNGTDIDIRLPRKAGYGMQSGTKTTWRSYDRDAMFAVMDAFGSNKNVERMIISDRDIKARAIREGKSWAAKIVIDKKHISHLHVDVKAMWEG